MIRYGLALSVVLLAVGCKKQLMAINYRPLQMGVPETTFGVFEWRLHKDKETWAEGFIVSVGSQASLAGGREKMRQGFEYWVITKRVEITDPEAFVVTLVDVVQSGEADERVDMVAARLADPKDYDILPPQAIAPAGLDVPGPSDASLVWCRAQANVARQHCTSPMEGPSAVQRRASLRFVIAAAAEKQVLPTWYWWAGASPDLFGPGQSAQIGDHLVFDVRPEPMAAGSRWRCIGPSSTDPGRQCDGTAPPL